MKGMEGVWLRSHEDVFAAGADKFFIAREKGSGKNMYYEFCAYDTIEQFHSRIKKIKSPSFHELVPAWRARRIHFDLDCSVPIERDELVTDILRACAVELLKTFDVTLNPEEVVVLDASKDGKTSVHIILTSIVALTPYECRKFCSDVTFQLRRILPESRYDYASYLDMAIYDKNRCFRLPLCTKRGQSRPLIPIPFTYNGNLYDHACGLGAEELMSLASVGVVDPTDFTRVHYDMPTERKYEERVIDEVEVRTVLDLVKSTFTATEWSCFEVGAVLPGYIELKRVNSGPCRVCRRVHDRLGAKVGVSESGRVNFVCWGRSNAPEYVGFIHKSATSCTSTSSKSGGGLASKYLSIQTKYDTARTSSDFIAALIEKYGYIE